MNFCGSWLLNDWVVCLVDYLLQIYGHPLVFMPNYGTLKLVHTGNGSGPVGVATEQFVLDAGIEFENVSDENQWEAVSSSADACSESILPDAALDGSECSTSNTEVSTSNTEVSTSNTEVSTSNTEVSTSNTEISTSNTERMSEGSGGSANFCLPYIVDSGNSKYRSPMENKGQRMVRRRRNYYEFGCAWSWLNHLMPKLCAVNQLNYLHQAFRNSRIFEILSNPRNRFCIAPTSQGLGLPLVYLDQFWPMVGSELDAVCAVSVRNNNTMVEKTLNRGGSKRLRTEVESGYHSQRSSPPNSVPVETSSGIASAVSTSTKNCTDGVQNGCTVTNPVEYEPSCATDCADETSDGGDMHGFHRASYITPLCNNGRYELSKMDVLSEEVWYYHQTITQTETVLNKKLHLRDMLYYSISPVFPMCGLYVVGSSLNGFGNNASDMDLCLMITNKDLDQRTDAVVVLNMIQSALADVKWVLDMHLILAKVPILRLKFVEPFHNITVDLNANNSVAIRNTHLLCYYSSFDWRVRPLVSVVKEWAKRKDINDANRSSFTSYSLVLMVIHYLQCGLTQPILPSLQAYYPKRFNPNADVRTLNVSMKLETPHGWQINEVVTLGELLIGFLHYYAYKFDYIKDAISVRLGRKIPRTTVARQQLPYNGSIAQWNCICIEEPFTLSNTAHSMHNQVLFDAIREAFIESYQELNVNRDLKVFLDVKPIAVPTGTFNSSAQLSAMLHSDELTLSCTDSVAGRRKTKSLESSRSSDSQVTLVNANNHERDKATEKDGSVSIGDVVLRPNNKVIFRVSEEDEINNLQNASAVKDGESEVLARASQANKSTEESLENHSPKRAESNSENTPTGDDMTDAEKSCKSVLSERQPRSSSGCSPKSAEHQRCDQSVQKATERQGRGLRRSRDPVTGNIGPKGIEVVAIASEAAASAEVDRDSKVVSS